MAFTRGSYGKSEVGGSGFIVCAGIQLQHLSEKGSLSALCKAAVPVLEGGRGEAHKIFLHKEECDW